jgi:hypothetical protein
MAKEHYLRLFRFEDLLLCKYYMQSVLGLRAAVIRVVPFQFHALNPRFKGNNLALKHVALLFELSHALARLFVIFPRVRPAGLPPLRLSSQAPSSPFPLLGVVRCILPPNPP